MKFGFTPESELANGRLAMASFVVMVIVYLKTGQLLPGVFQYIILLKTLKLTKMLIADIFIVLCVSAIVIKASMYSS